MSADVSAFSCLPLAVRDSLLQQAFQQLGQRHLFGVAPRVCRLWHQLSLSIITSLDIRVTTEAAAEQLSLWMNKRGAGGLNSLLVLLYREVCPTHAACSLVQSLQTAMQLRNLGLSSSSAGSVLDVPLPPLTNLISLSVKHISITPTVVSSILGLTSLNSLNLTFVRVNVDGADSKYAWDSIVEQMATCLVGLTSLTLLMMVSVSSGSLAHLRALPQLKRLEVVGHAPIAASSLRHLTGLPMTSIHIASTTEALSDASTWLHSAAPGLEYLALSLDRVSTASACFSPLHKAVHLESLHLNKVKPDIMQLAALTQLTRLSLRDCDMYDADVCRLSALTGLRSLDLSCNPGFAGAQGSLEVLARSLPQLRSLELFGTAAQEAAQRVFQGRGVEIPES